MIDWSWLSFDDKVYFIEYYCFECGNTYTTDDIMSKCPICGGNE